MQSLPASTANIAQSDLDWSVAIPPGYVLYGLHLTSDSLTGKLVYNIELRRRIAGGVPHLIAVPNATGDTIHAEGFKALMEYVQANEALFR